MEINDKGGWGMGDGGMGDGGMEGVGNGSKTNTITSATYVVMVSALGNVSHVWIAWVVQLWLINLQVSDLQTTGDKALHLESDVNRHLPEIHQLLFVDYAEEHQLSHHHVLFSSLDLVELPPDVVV